MSVSNLVYLEFPEYADITDEMFDGIDFVNTIEIYGAHIS